MEVNLQHEDLLIKLRGKLNEEKIKLWEPPFLEDGDGVVSQSLQQLALKYSTDLSVEQEIVLQALHELQLHSVDRSKANAEYKETGFATFRVKGTITGQKPKIVKIQMKLDEMGSELIAAVAREMEIEEVRIKLIFNGKVIKDTPSLEEQGIKNGAQIMALILATTPDEVKKEDNLYMEMKSTRDDAALLSQYADDDYMKLEDQSGKTVAIPASERRALLVGLTLHERGRAAAKQHDYPLALVLLLEADRQLSECSAAILKSVDNYAVLQLDVSWCYLCLQSLAAAPDAANRLARAGKALRQLYGDRPSASHARGETDTQLATKVSERVLLMRLYLLQGILAYHQNKRTEAKALLESAETELNYLRVDEAAVAALMELGWSRSAARQGLRATGGDSDRAHLYLAARHAQRQQQRLQSRQQELGLCRDGAPVKEQLLEALAGMGYGRRLAKAALRRANNRVAEAVRLIQEEPEALDDGESSEETESLSSDESLLRVDSSLVDRLQAMGYSVEDAKAALRLSKNELTDAVDLLVAGGGHIDSNANPSTSAASPEKKKHKRHVDNKNKEECEQALQRLSSAIRHEDDDHLDTSLQEEEEFLAQYKSLL